MGLGGGAEGLALEDEGDGVEDAALNVRQERGNGFADLCEGVCELLRQAVAEHVV